MARILYALGTLAVVSSAIWLYEVLRATGAFEASIDYQVYAPAAVTPLIALVGGVLVIAFGVVLTRLKAIQYTGELSADALAELVGRDRGRSLTGSSVGPLNSLSENASSTDSELLVTKTK
jgi:hypothetical protein